MKQYVVDAFTDKVFAGNPAAVCVMDKWLSDELMMKITVENNLSETAFCVKEGRNYHLRWFTPGGEIDLCGHATLGTACAIMTFVEPERTEVTFATLSGDLTSTTDSIQCRAGILAGDTVSAAAKDDGSRGHDTIGARCARSRSAASSACRRPSSTTPTPSVM